jgi:hypothetical protein
MKKSLFLFFALWQKAFIRFWGLDAGYWIFHF